MKHSTIVLKYFFVSDNETLRIFPFLSEQSLIYYPWFTNYDVTMFLSHRHGRAYTTALNKPKSWSNHLPVGSKRKSFAKSQRKNTTLLTSSRRVVRVRWKRGKKNKKQKKENKVPTEYCKLFHNALKSRIFHRFVNYGVRKCKSEFRYLEPDQRLTSTHYRKSTLVLRNSVTHRSDHRNDIYIMVCHRDSKARGFFPFRTFLSLSVVHPICSSLVYSFLSLFQSAFFRQTLIRVSFFEFLLSS